MNSLKLEVRHLQLVAAIAKEGTLTRAAQRLHLTQSAVSHQLKLLETSLGVSLFERSTRRLAPTSAGTRLTTSAVDILEHLRRTEEELLQHNQTSRRTVRISTECYTLYHWLPSVLRALREEMPRLDTQIVLEATRRPVEALLDGRIDAAIALSPVKSRRLNVQPMFEDELLVIVQKGHELAGRKWIEAADLSDEQWISYDIALDELSVYHSFFRPANVVPRILRVPLTEVILELVRAGLGFAIFARWAISPSLEKGDLVAVRLTRKGHWRQWKVITMAGKAVPGEVRQFADVLVKQARMTFASGQRKS